MPTIPFALAPRHIYDKYMRVLLNTTIHENTFVTNIDNCKRYICEDTGIRAIVSSSSFFGLFDPLK